MNEFIIKHEEAQNMSKLLKNYSMSDWSLTHISGTLDYVLKLTDHLKVYFGF